MNGRLIRAIQNFKFTNRDYILQPLINQRRFVHHHKEWEINKELYLGVQRSQAAKANRNTHINERKYRRARALKTVLIDLPDDVERRSQENMSSEEIRVALLKKGINPFKKITPREWSEQQLSLQSFYSLLDSFIVSESSKFFKSNISEKKNEIKERLQHKFYNYWHGTRRIKKKVGFEKFNAKSFGPTAENIYVCAHQALVERNKLLMHKYLTENAFGQMWPEAEKSTIIWELICFNKPSEVLSVRCADNPSKSGNDIAQLTVKMHSTQKLTIYDRFGHLLLGSENEPKDCVEYVVFENHIANVDGAWRLHDKIYPHWLKPKQSTVYTVVEQETVAKPQPLGLGFTKRLEEGEKKRVKDEKLGNRL